MHKSKHQQTGEGNELWVQRQWGRYVTALLDEPYASLILMPKDGWGVGVVGSVHMAPRTEEEKYILQLAVVRLTLCRNKGAWGVLIGDWNRDIRVHSPTQMFLEQLDAQVSPISQDQPLLKDYAVTYGVHSVSRLLPHVPDHPLVLTHVTEGLQAVTDSVQLMVYGWGAPEYKMFGNELEACSLMPWNTHEWVALCRHLMHIVNTWQ